MVSSTVQITALLRFLSVIILAGLIQLYIKWGYGLDNPKILLKKTPSHTHTHAIIYRIKRYNRE